MKRTTALTAALLAALAATAVAQTQRPPLPPATQPTAEDWRTPDPSEILVIDTSKGRILVEMVPETAPNHIARIRNLVRAGFYDGLTFFRVIEGFMAQTGDPQNNGTGASEFPDLNAEFTFRRGADMPFVLAADQTVSEVGFVKTLPVMTQSMMLAPLTGDQSVSGWGLFCTGVTGMARGQDNNSANSQFFLMRDAYPALEKRYTAWGRVISGQQVVRAFKTGEPVEEPSDRMERVRLLADLSEADRPTIRIINTAGAWFKDEIARERAAKGPDFTPCDVNIPVEVN